MSRLGEILDGLTAVHAQMRRLEARRSLLAMAELPVLLAKEAELQAAFNVVMGAPPDKPDSEDDDDDSGPDDPAPGPKDLYSRTDKDLV